MTLVPPGAVTRTSTMPVPAGLIAVSWVGDTTCTPVAATPPKVTVAGVAKLVPVMVTVVPPAAGPDDGDTFVTVGGDRKEARREGAVVRPRAVTRPSTKTVPAG